MDTVESVDRLLEIARDRWLHGCWCGDMTVVEVAQQDIDRLLEQRFSLAAWGQS